MGSSPGLGPRKRDEEPVGSIVPPTSNFHGRHEEPASPAARENGVVQLFAPARDAESDPVVTIGPVNGPAVSADRRNDGGVDSDLGAMEKRQAVSDNLDSPSVLDTDAGEG